jgi:hypothetical protein
MEESLSVSVDDKAEVKPVSLPPTLKKTPPAIYIEEQDPDVFYDVPVRCVVTG